MYFYKKLVRKNNNKNKTMWNKNKRKLIYIYIYIYCIDCREKPTSVLKNINLHCTFMYRGKRLKARFTHCLASTFKYLLFLTCIYISFGSCFWNWINLNFKIKTIFCLFFSKTLFVCLFVCFLHLGCLNFLAELLRVLIFLSRKK